MLNSKEYYCVSSLVLVGCWLWGATGLGSRALTGKYDLSVHLENLPYHYADDTFDFLSRTRPAVTLPSFRVISIPSEIGLKKLSCSQYLEI